MKNSTLKYYILYHKVPKEALWFSLLISGTLLWFFWFCVVLFWYTLWFIFC